MSCWLNFNLLTNTTVVDDAIRFVTGKGTKTLTSKTDHHVVVSERQQQEDEAEEKITTNQVF